MIKNIWVVNSNKKELIETQRIINSNGGLRAFSMLSYDAVVNVINRQQEGNENYATPSLIVLDYTTELNEDFVVLKMLQENAAYAGVPIFFMVETKSEDLDEECYAKGATVVLRKPFSKASILRIERTAWQHDMTINYEKALQKQTGELAAAKVIRRLNEQLKTRNEVLHQIFGRYFSDEIMEIILDNPEGAVLGGNKKEITVMMADLRGFTSVSDRLGPEVVTGMLNNFLGEMTEIITSYKGTVIEFIGDAILAVFGAPIDMDNSEAYAVSAAIVMQNRMKKVNRFNKKNGYPSIEMGIGIHKGEVFIGNIGSEKVMRYNVIGQAVNLCSRIEGYSVGGQILVSKTTVDSINAPVNIYNTFDIFAKGVEQSVSICDVIGIDGDYNVIIEKTPGDTSVVIDENIIIHMHLIMQKKVAKKPIKATLISVSKKRAIVKLKKEADIDIYDNLEVFGFRSGESVFKNVYAKIVGIKDDILTLYFTYVSDDYVTFYIDKSGITEEEYYD